MTYLGIIVVSHLDRFAAECYDVCRDDGTCEGRPAGQNVHYQATTTPPEFRPLELDVDWRLLPKNSMYSIIRIPDQRDQLHGKLRGIQDFSYEPPDYPDFFWERRRGYSVLGLQASGIG